MAPRRQAPSWPADPGEMERQSGSEHGSAETSSTVAVVPGCMRSPDVRTMRHVTAGLVPAERYSKPDRARQQPPTPPSPRRPRRRGEGGHTWLRAGKDRLALAPTNGGRSRRYRVRRNALLEKHPRLRKLVDDAIECVYLTKARRPISAVTRRVIDDLQRRNARLPAEQAVPIPRQSTLARSIARRIRQLDAWEVDRQRWGRRIADRRHAPSNSPSPRLRGEGRGEGSWPPASFSEWKSITAR